MASDSDEDRDDTASFHHHNGNLSIAQARILRALSYGGMLTRHQIQAAAGLTQWMTRRVITDLTRRGLIFTTTTRPGRYQIAPLGRNTLAGDDIAHAIAHVMHTENTDAAGAIRLLISEGSSVSR